VPLQAGAQAQGEPKLAVQTWPTGQLPPQKGNVPPHEGVQLHSAPLKRQIWFGPHDPLHSGPLPPQVLPASAGAERNATQRINPTASVADQ